MRGSFKVMHDELYTVKVRISPGWARWVGEKIWHESQKEFKSKEKAKDGFLMDVLSGKKIMVVGAENGLEAP